GMADVFLAVARGQMGFNKLAVLKRLRQALAEETAFRNMFLDEARLAARLNHPNIVHTYEVGEQNGVYFIAMEYLEGQSLNKVMKEALRRKETIDPAISARIIADALAGLQYAHELNDYDGRPLSIIHRDVSPHNIFVTYDGHTKVVDFGIAKAALSSTETEVGVLKGKVAYMSPEQAMGGPIDARSDVFAMGIVLWELLARQRLMTGESAANTLHKLMNEPIPLVSSVAPGIDPALDMIVARALEKDRELRFQSSKEMKDALEQYLASRPSAPRQDDVAQRMGLLFGNVREEVQRQIQRHMATLTAASNTQELQALTVESLKRMEQSGANVTGHLLRLGNGSGSGSGVVPSYAMGTPSVGSMASAAYPGMHSSMTPPPQPRSNNTLLVVVAVGFFLLAGLLIVVFGMRTPQRPTPQPVAVAPTPVPVDPSPPAPTAPLAPPSLPTGVVTADTPPEPTTAPADPTPTPAPTPTTRTTAVRPPPVRPSTPTAKPPVAPPATPEPSEPGYLTIFSYPWAKVTEGGRVVCASTPCTRVQMSPGAHTLTLENAEQGYKAQLGVSIKSGEETKKRHAFK
ncbi:MAG: serine/threonine protein kinase, partial [Myxococcales bacterium]|nr:serine/threonine protein kinase [Myxococcales bacterium]